MPQAALVLGAAASVIGTVSSISSARRAERLQQQQQTVATRQSRLQAIRQQQILRAQATASAQGSGALGGSGLLGGLGSLGSQLGSQFGYSTQMSGLSRGISQASQSAQLGQAIAGFGATAYNYGQSQGQTLDTNIKYLRGLSPRSAGSQMNFGSMYGNSAYPQGI